MQDRIILDLCGGSGSWSAPYAEAGYTVLIIDPKVSGFTVEEFLQDLQAMETFSPIHGVLAAPPCTAFSGSGAHLWPSKDASGQTARGILVAKACLDVIALVKPQWWALENPVGRLRRLVPEVGPVRLTFDPADYGDPYTKRTQIFGSFTVPPKKRVQAHLGSMIVALSPSAERSTIRSKTPPGFAKAFFLANP